MRRSIHGILLLDKPIGMTSNGVLQRVKRLFNAKKAGHTGSLDPIATGMLPICMGEATKFSQFLLDSDKAYSVVAKLGERTNTGDTEGEVVETLPVIDLTSERVQEAIAQFVGEIDQIPPMFSAIKIQGKALYKLARQGIEIERQSRRIKIFSLSLDHLDVENNLLHFHVHCSKGTYVRTLVEDIGKALNCGAHVQELRRTMVTPYGNTKMHTLTQLEAIAEQAGMTGLDACLLPVETTVRQFPALELSTSAAFYLRQGQAVRATLPSTLVFNSDNSGSANPASSGNFDSSLIRLMTEGGRFIGVGQAMPSGIVKPHRLLNLN
jgi:tRNA pseudouridine55 synthase